MMIKRERKGCQEERKLGYRVSLVHWWDVRVGNYQQLISLVNKQQESGVNLWEDNISQKCSYTLE